MYTPIPDAEKPVARPYILVEDIREAVAAVADSGATTAVTPMEIPDCGQCAIIIQGELETGLWQL